MLLSNTTLNSADEDEDLAYLSSMPEEKAEEDYYAYLSSMDYEDIEDMEDPRDMKLDVENKA